MFFQTLVQHNDSARLWSVNFRVGWLQDANTGLFLVYKRDPGPLRRPGRPPRLHPGRGRAQPHPEVQLPLRRPPPLAWPASHSDLHRAQRSSSHRRPARGRARSAGQTRHVSSAGRSAMLGTSARFGASARLGAWMLAAAVPVGASEQQQPAAGLAVAPGVRSLSAVGVEAAPVLDGAVLGDPAWAAAEPASGFVQTQPDEGGPASERDRGPHRLQRRHPSTSASSATTPTRRRSSSPTAGGTRRWPDSDSFQLILDTFLDRQNGSSSAPARRGRSTTGSSSTRGPGAAAWAGAGRRGARAAAST